MLTKVITYGSTLELFQYENDLPRITERQRELQVQHRRETLALRKRCLESESEITIRRTDNARRASVAFKRLVGANLGEPVNPVLATFTYATHTDELRRGYKDFQSFSRRAKSECPAFRYVCVPEFQKSGRLHFHALLWGLEAGVVARERDTRMVARWWRQGFVDLTETDGSIKLAGYLAKYMTKGLSDVRLARFRAYRASRNIVRPVFDSKPILQYYFEKYELSPVSLLTDFSFDTKWVGKGRYREYKIKKYEDHN